MNESSSHSREIIEAITLSNIVFSYNTEQGPLSVLNGLNLRIPKQQICGLVGPSGCGKTTVLKIIGDLMRQTHVANYSGSAEVFGSSPTVARRDRRICIVPQHNSLFPWWSVLDNVLLSARIGGLEMNKEIERAKELLDIVGLKSFSIGRVTDLSGGMRQRVTIVRALLHSGDLMLFDEPLTSLDEMVREELGLLLQKLWLRFRSTVVLVSHDLSETILLCDRVVVMSQRPANIVADVYIDLPRPRKFEHRLTKVYSNALKQIRDALTHSSVMGITK